MQQTPQDVSQDDKKHFILREILFWFYHVFVLVIAALLIVYASRTADLVSNIQTTPSYMRAKQTIDFWSKGYIIDIKAVSTMNCPQGYESLIDYQWDGTKQGCSCSAMLNNYYYEIILEGACNADLIANNCQRVPAMSSEAMNFWKGGKLLCVKRIQSLTFYTSTVNTSAIACSSGKTYQVNTYSGVNCPISNISNSSLGVMSSTITLDSNYLLSMLRSATYPIAAFKMTQYEFCPTWSEKNIQPNKTGNYILQPINITTCVGTDPRVVTFDSLDQESLINNNYNIKADINSLPAYPRPSNVYQFKLGYVPYPAWTYSCRTNPNLNLTVATSHMRLQDQKYISKIVFNFTVSFASVFGFLMRIFYLVRRAKQLKGKSEYGRVYQNQRELARRVPNLNYIHNPKVQITLIVFDFLLTIGLLTVILIGVTHFSSYSLWYKSVFQNSCTDTFLINVFQTYEKSLDDGYYNLVISAVLLLLIIAFDILFVIFRCCAYDLRKVEKASAPADVESEDDANRMAVPVADSSLEFKDKDLLMGKDLDAMMEDDIERETKDNFYNVYGAENDLGVKKKKKKKPLKKKNLFKKEEPEEDSKVQE